MKRRLISTIMILVCMLVCVACNENNDKNEYTYPEYQLKEESTVADTVEEEQLQTTEPADLLETESFETDTTEASNDSLDSTSEETGTESETETHIVLDTQERETFTDYIEIETASKHIDSKDENGYCDICGEKIEADTADEIETVETIESIEETSEEITEETISADSALFDKFYDSNFDTSGTAHSNGGKMTEKSDTYNAGVYQLKFLNYVNLYKNARDAKGNPALKLGKSDAVGYFEIIIPENVSSVIFKVAKYKEQDSSVRINGVEYKLTKNSNDGVYDEIIIDTSETKKIMVSTTEANKICMIRSIEFRR